MENFNTTLFLFFNQLAGRSAFEDWTIVFFADYLPYIVGAVFIVGLFLWKMPRPEKIKAFSAALVSALAGRGVLVEVIRFFYHHPRPSVVLPQVHPLFFESSYSFPSGHATFFFGLAVVAYRFNKKAGAVFFILSGIIGLARVAAGVHYPFDILGGALLGSFVGVLSSVLAQRLFPKKLRVVEGKRDTI